MRPSQDKPVLKQESLRRSNGPLAASISSEIVHSRLVKLRDELTEPECLESLQLSPAEFRKEWSKFEKSIAQWLKAATPEVSDLASQDARGKTTLEQRLRYQFYAQTCGGRFTSAELENQKEVADLRYPAEWYPATREIPRQVHLHVGPTNSGKTYHALKRLEEAKTGIFLGPLRLLAHEIYTRLNAKGKSCALVTGEEQRMPEGSDPSMFCCTVEMAPLNTPFDIAVIDEIQMIGSPDRGWAWTQAFFGLQAKEIHLCGEARAVPLMRELCALVGDKVHIHEYERLTPLQVQPRSLGGNLQKLEKGDCIVAFTVLGIHALRQEIEKKTQKKCAIVYGSLPPETRAQQARLFNDPDNDYDYLVASDAIGMGLNLAIKRVIFESTVKSNSVKFVPLQISEIKQIAGRAGRFKTAHQAVVADSSHSSVVAATPTVPAIGLDDSAKEAVVEKTIGWVTTLDQVDHSYLRMGMTREPEEIKTAGLFPPSLTVERFASYFPPGTPFSYILLRLHEISEIHPRFHLCALRDQLAIADAIHTIKGLSTQDRITICAAPVNMRDMGEKRFLRAMAEAIAGHQSGGLLDLEPLPLYVMNATASGNRGYLYGLEHLHKMVVSYLWLSYRFPNVFTTRSLANYTKKLVEDQIEKTLKEFSFVRPTKDRRIKNRASACKDVDDLDHNVPSHRSDPHDIQALPGIPTRVKDHVDKHTAFVESSTAVDDVQLSKKDGNLLHD
ncbi:RNA helicase [Coniothyrium glycines]